MSWTLSPAQCKSNCRFCVSSVTPDAPTYSSNDRSHRCQRWHWLLASPCAFNEFTAFTFRVTAIVHFSRRQCNTTNSNSQMWVWYLLYCETYTGSIIVELPVPFWSRYRSVLIIGQSSLVSLLSVGWRSRSGYYHRSI